MVLIDMHIQFPTKKCRKLLTEKKSPKIRKFRVFRQTCQNNMIFCESLGKKRFKNFVVYLTGKCLGN